MRTDVTWIRSTPVEDAIAPELPLGVVEPPALEPAPAEPDVEPAPLLPAPLAPAPLLLLPPVLLPEPAVDVPEAPDPLAPLRLLSDMDPLDASMPVTSTRWPL